MPWEFPEIRLRSAGVAPPIVVPGLLGVIAMALGRAVMPRRIRPDEVARDHRADAVATRGLNCDGAPPVHDESADRRRGSAADVEPEAPRGHRGAIEFDEEHGVRPDGVGVHARARLGVAVDDDGLQDRVEVRRGGDRVDAGARDVERDRVGPGAQIGVEDRLAQRPGAAVVGVRHGERRGRQLSMRGSRPA